jgi:hypothetical protein
VVEPLACNVIAGVSFSVGFSTLLQDVNVKAVIAKIAINDFKSFIMNWLN